MELLNYLPRKKNDSSRIKEVSCSWVRKGNELFFQREPGKDQETSWSVIWRDQQFLMTIQFESRTCRLHFLLNGIHHSFVIGNAGGMVGVNGKLPEIFSNGHQLKVIIQSPSGQIILRDTSCEKGFLLMTILIEDLIWTEPYKVEIAKSKMEIEDPTKKIALWNGSRNNCFVYFENGDLVFNAWEIGPDWEDEIQLNVKDKEVLKLAALFGVPAERISSMLLLRLKDKMNGCNSIAEVRRFLDRRGIDYQKNSIYRE